MTPSLVPQGIRETNRIFEEVVASGNFSALERVYTRQARLLPPAAEMITGRESIQAFWQQAVEALSLKTARLETVELEILGETAFEIGRAELVAAQAASPLTVKYVVVWKQEDGAWKWHVDIWNPVS